MNRRAFLHKSSIAVVAAAGLPRALRNQQQNTPSVYKTVLKTGEAGQSYYELGLYHSTIQSFASAAEEEKTIGLKVNYYGTDDLAAPTSTGEYKYIIKKVEQTDATNNIWRITTKLDKKISGDHKFSKDFPKNLVFECKPGSYINILNKKSVSLVSIPYPPAASSGSGSGGCFLTTACVKHKGLADDCEELTTLRFLRDKFMIRSEEGRRMISLYKQSGPVIEKAIASCDNKAAIYEYMHSHMIIPAVELVHQGNYKAAVYHYKIFVTALSKQYC